MTRRGVRVMLVVGGLLGALGAGSPVGATTGEPASSALPSAYTIIPVLDTITGHGTIIPAPDTIIPALDTIIPGGRGGAQ